MNRKIYLIFILIFAFACIITSAILNDDVLIKEEKILSGDVTLFTRIIGDPKISPVLIAINGGPGQSSHYMKSLKELTKFKVAVVTYDQRGTGRSSESSQGYALKNHISDIENIRKHLQVKKIILFGHSFGGILAQFYAANYPEHVGSLILMGSGPPAITGIRTAQMRLGQRIQQLVSKGIIKGPQPSKPSELLKYMLPAYFSDPTFPIPGEILKSSFHMNISMKTYTDSGAWDFSEKLKIITCPVLFLWGEDDPFGMEMADVSKNALVNAKLDFVVLKKCGHYWQENEKDFFLSISEFLNKYF